MFSIVVPVNTVFSTYTSQFVGPKRDSVRMDMKKFLFSGSMKGREWSACWTFRR